MHIWGPSHDPAAMTHDYKIKDLENTLEGEEDKTAKVSRESGLGLEKIAVTDQKLEDKAFVSNPGILSRIIKKISDFFMKLFSFQTSSKKELEINDFYDVGAKSEVKSRKQENAAVVLEIKEEDEEKVIADFERFDVFKLRNKVIEKGGRGKSLTDDPQKEVIFKLAPSLNQFAIDKDLRTFRHNLSDDSILKPDSLLTSLSLEVAFDIKDNKIFGEYRLVQSIRDSENPKEIKGYVVRSKKISADIDQLKKHSVGDLPILQNDLLSSEVLTEKPEDLSSIPMTSIRIRKK